MIFLVKWFDLKWPMSKLCNLKYLMHLISKIIYILIVYIFKITLINILLFQEESYFKVSECNFLRSFSRTSNNSVCFLVRFFQTCYIVAYLKVLIQNINPTYYKNYLHVFGAKNLYTNVYRLNTSIKYMHNFFTCKSSIADKWYSSLLLVHFETFSLHVYLFY